MKNQNEPPFLRTAYNYDRNKASDASGLKCKDLSRTKQSFAEDADINTIVKRFNLTGQLPTNVRMPTYGDFTEVTDFHTAMNAVAQARESFDAMPPHIRERFHNDPAEFVDFCSDEDNREEARKLGLVPPAELPRGEPGEKKDPPENASKGDSGGKTDT